MGLYDTVFGGGGSKDTEAALAELQKVPLPVLKEYYPDLYEQVVSLNPEAEQAISLGPSEMAGVATDPALRQAQLKALNKLQQVGDAGGRDAQFMADSNQLMTDVGASNQGREGAIMQNLATRGMSGGMTEMVARNQSAQSATNTQAQNSLSLKAQAEQRALQALMNSGTLSTQMQGQDFSQQAAKASASDAISKFNVANTQDVNSRNVQTRNNAQTINAQQKQTTANSNTGLKNEAQQYNLNLAQKNFDNQMQKAGGVAGAYQNSADAKNKDRDREAQFVGGLISTGARAYAGGG